MCSKLVDRLAARVYVVQIRLTAAEFAALEQTAAAGGETKSSMIRRLLREAADAAGVPHEAQDDHES